MLTVLFMHSTLIHIDFTITDVIITAIVDVSIAFYRVKWLYAWSAV
jgi:hypothetical protein